MITCKQCLEREKELKGTRADQIYDVGNPAKEEMGHAMYFTNDGKITLCIARKK